VVREGRLHPGGGLFTRLGKRYQAINYWSQLPGLAPEPGGTQLIPGKPTMSTKSQVMPLVMRIALLSIGIWGQCHVRCPVLASSSTHRWQLPLRLSAFYPSWRAFLVVPESGQRLTGGHRRCVPASALSCTCGGALRSPGVMPPAWSFHLDHQRRELSTMGAVAFVRQNGPQLRRQAETGRVYVLNFDGPGVNGKLYWWARSLQASRQPAPHCSLWRARLVRTWICAWFILPCRVLCSIISPLAILAWMLDHHHHCRDSLKVHTPQDTPTA